MSVQFGRRPPHRAQQIMGAVGRRYPQAWAQADAFRAMRGDELPRWPDWCYLPLHGAYALVSGGADQRVPLDRIHHVGIVGALAAWRMGQGVYRYDRDLALALDDTPMPEDLPASLLYRLPEWCVYIETPGLWAPDGRPLAGAWVHLDWDEAGADELRLVLDCDEPLDDRWHSLIPIPLILGQGSIAESIARVVASGQMRMAEHAGAHPGAFERHLIDQPELVAERLWPIVSRALYLCADAADLARRPVYPEPKRTRDGWRLFPAGSLQVWPVGERIGAAIRRAREANDREDREALASGRARPRPHVRRAHWHSYWTGPRGEDRADQRRLIARWQPPMGVNVDDPSALPATIHHVEDDYAD